MTIFKTINQMTLDFFTIYLKEVGISHNVILFSGHLRNKHGVCIVIYCAQLYSNYEHGTYNTGSIVLRNSQ